MLNLPEPPTINIIIIVVVGHFAGAHKEIEPIFKTWMFCHLTYSKKMKIGY